MFRKNQSFSDNWMTAANILTHLETLIEEMTIKTEPPESDSSEEEDTEQENNNCGNKSKLYGPD